MTTNRCNRGSRSCWLDLKRLEELRTRVPGLAELSERLAGLGHELQAATKQELRVQATTMTLGMKRAIEDLRAFGHVSVFMTYI